MGVLLNTVKAVPGRGGGLGKFSRSPPLLEAVVFRLFGSRWQRPVFGLSPVAGQPEVLGANQRREG